MKQLNGHEYYGHYFSLGDGNFCKFEIDLTTKKIEFSYSVSEDLGFVFDLFSEIGALYQPIFRTMLAEDKITLGILDTKNEYCNIVTSE